MYWISIVLVIFVVLFFVIRRRAPKTTDGEVVVSEYFPVSGNFLFQNEYDGFPIAKLENRIIDFLRKKRIPALNSNLFSRTTRSEEKARKRGFKFENKIQGILNKHICENRESYFLSKKELKLSPTSRADFVLSWEISKDQKFNVIVECKHSFNRISKLNQIEEGKEQLFRYKNCFRSANLLVLLVDFSLDYSGYPFHLDGKILIINYNIFEDFLCEISNFVVEQRK